MVGEIAATKDGRILAIRSNVLADHGAFNGTAAPVKYPAGFFGVFTGSYDIEAAYCHMTAVYTNKAPGGVAYACSFRITEAVYFVERLVDCLAFDLKMDPAAAAAAEPVEAGPVPVHVEDRLGLRLGRLRDHHAQGHGHDRLRRAAGRAEGEARARRADGHRHVVLHRGGRGGATQGYGHPRARHGRRLRAPCPSDRQSRCAAFGSDPGAGPRDDIRPDRRRGAGHSARRHRRGARRHRPDAVRPRHLRQPLDAGVGGCRGAGRTQGQGQGEDHRLGHARGVRSPTWNGRRGPSTSRATRRRR